MLKLNMQIKLKMKEKYLKSMLSKINNFGGAILDLNTFPCESLFSLKKELIDRRGEEWDTLYYDEDKKVPNYLEKAIIVVDEDINTLDYLLKTDIILEEVIIICPSTNSDELNELVHESNKEWVIK